jgi:hypothetical protein
VPKQSDLLGGQAQAHLGPLPRALALLLHVRHVQHVVAAAVHALCRRRVQVPRYRGVRRALRAQQPPERGLGLAHRGLQLRPHLHSLREGLRAG